MTISTSKGEYYYYRCTGKKRLHNCDCAPIGVDYLEQRVAETVKSILGSPTSTGHLIEILRSQAETLQSGAAARLTALIEKEKDITAKLNNAADAVLNGLYSPSLQNRIRSLEIEKAEVERDMHILKRDVDASAIPEYQLREILETITTSPGSDIAILLSIVYRVEVGKDTITIWTLLDTDPKGDIDLGQEGVTITSCLPFGVPIVFVTAGFIRITVAR
jgi:hypothetical protein